MNTRASSDQGGEYLHRERRAPVPTASRNWLIATGIAATAVLALLWRLHAEPPPSLMTDLDIAHAASEPAASASHHVNRSSSSAAATPHGTPLPGEAIGIETTSPASADPARIAHKVAHLLGGTPVLDIGHLSAMMAIARDPSLPLGDRVAAIRWLARFGDDEAVDVLEGLLLDDASSTVRSAVATALGECPHPDATRILIVLLEDEDPDVVLGAIRGLANRRDPGATLALTTLLADKFQNDEVRSAAAAALGQHDGAAADLRLAFASAGGELARGALAGLARQPFPESEPVFRELLADPDAPLDMKIDAIDALGEGTPEAAGFLLELARNADEPALRSAAIDALALFDEPGDTLHALGDLVLSEPSAEVRADLYNTLSLHADLANAESDAAKLVHMTLSESTPRLRLEGYRMVASMLHDQYQPGLAETFDTRMVSWLRESAEHGNDRYTRRLAVDALGLANTPGARQALLDLSYSADTAVSGSAQKTLQVASKTGDSNAQ